MSTQHTPHFAPEMSAEASIPQFAADLDAAKHEAKAEALLAFWEAHRDSDRIAVHEARADLALLGGTTLQAIRLATERFSSVSRISK